MAITAANLRTSQYQFQQDTATGRWSWFTVMNLSGVGPTFSIERITSPYGVLRDSIPIPGEVVESMSQSISEVRTQFPPNILLNPTAITLDLDEGRGFSEPVTVSLTNNGVFGSLLGASLATSAAYVTVTPALLGNLASNEAGEFEVAADSSELLAINSPYVESVTVTDSTAANNPQTLTVTINVRPKSEISVTPTTLTFTVVKPLTGNFPIIPSQTFEIENTGPAGSVLNWQVQKVGCVNWLQSFAPVSGSLDSGETETITVAVAPPSSTGKGTFTETLRVSGYSSNDYVDVTITLVVT